MIDFTYNPIIPADYKSRGRGLPYEASPFGRALFFTEFLTERGESLLHKLKRDESSG